MGRKHLLLGRKGEKYAAKFLVQNGYTLETQNFKTPFAEIDIIARHEGFLCFIEVKTRRSNRRGMPKEAVTIAKQRKIILAATEYLKRFGKEEQRVRFDVLEVLVPPENFSIKKFAVKNVECILIPGAFQADSL